MKKLFAKLKKNIKKVIMVLAVLLLIGATVYVLKTRNRVSIEDSLIQAPLITLMPQAPGQLTELDTHEGAYVKKGDQLAVVGNQVIRADTDGLIVKTDDVVGGDVTPATAIVQMVNPSDMRVVGTLDENKGIIDIQNGQVISFTVDAIPGHTFWGYVDHVSPTAKQTQAAFSISSERPTQQFEVYAKFDASKYPDIKNGMSAKMTVYTNTH